MADNIDVKDAAGATKTFRTKDLGTTHLPFHGLMRSSGAELIGETTKANSVPISLPTDQTLLGRGLVNISASFTRPANTTAYSSGQLVANSTTAGSVVPLTFISAARYSAAGGRIVQARLTKTDASVTNAQFRLHIYSSVPTPSNGDGAAWLTTMSGYLGFYDFTMDKVFTNGAWGVASNIHDIYFSAAGTDLNGLLEARAAYTPASAEIFTPILEIVQG